MQSTFRKADENAVTSIQGKAEGNLNCSHGDRKWGRKDKRIWSYFESKIYGTWKMIYILGEKEGDIEDDFKLSGLW